MMSQQSRVVVVGAAQLGPIQKADTRASVVERLIALLRQAKERSCDLVVFPELALTTFFPRWFVDDISEADHWYEKSMPSVETQPLFDEAKKLGIGFSLGYAELTEPDHQGVVHRFNTQILVERDGSVVAKYHKVHIPGHEHHEPNRPFQHAERYYFEPGPEGFGVWAAFGGLFGMMICNDRRWPESYREMGLQGVEMILCGQTPAKIFCRVFIIRLSCNQVLTKMELGLSALRKAELKKALIPSDKRALLLRAVK